MPLAATTMGNVRFEDPSNVKALKEPPVLRRDNQPFNMHVCGAPVAYIFGVYNISFLNISACNFRVP